MVPRTPSTERRSRTLLQAWAAIAFISLGIVAVAVGPLDAPAEALVLAGLSLLLGIVIGMSRGRHQRRFLPIQGRGLRVSRSTDSEGVFRSFDVLGFPFELSQSALHAVITSATANAPSGSSTRTQDAGDLGDRAGPWEGDWLFHTQDSRGRAVVLDRTAIRSLMAEGADPRDLAAPPDVARSRPHAGGSGTDT